MKTPRLISGVLIGTMVLGCEIPHTDTVLNVSIIDDAGSDTNSAYTSTAGASLIITK